MGHIQSSNRSSHFKLTPVEISVAETIGFRDEWGQRIWGGAWLFGCERCVFASCTTRAISCDHTWRKVCDTTQSSWSKIRWSSLVWMPAWFPQQGTWVWVLQWTTVSCQEQKRYDHNSRGWHHDCWEQSLLAGCFSEAHEWEVFRITFSAGWSWNKCQFLETQSDRHGWLADADSRHQYFQSGEGFRGIIWRCESSEDSMQCWNPDGRCFSKVESKRCYSISINCWIVPVPWSRTSWPDVYN